MSSKTIFLTILISAGTAAGVYVAIQKIPALKAKLG